MNEPVEVSLGLLQAGGLMVVPSAPALTLLTTNRGYRAAALECDFAIVDSAYLSVIWFAITGTRLHRVSGLKFLREFVARGVGRAPGEVFLVNPTEDDSAANVALLQERGYAVDRDCCYTAPVYLGSVEDRALIEMLERKRPKYVFINLGGGVQEPLGLFLRKSLSFAPAIICTGAAIAFLTGRQARIPDWADASGLGWLFRIANQPRRFSVRYVESIRLASLLWQYRREAPPMD